MLCLLLALSLPFVPDGALLDARAAAPDSARQASAPHAQVGVGLDTWRRAERGIDPGAMRPPSRALARTAPPLDPVDDGEAEAVDRLHYGRIAVLAVPVGVAVGGVFYYLETTWWAENARRFHFDDGSDLRYAINMDKAAHFIGGAVTADAAYPLLRWAHLSERDAYLAAAGFGTLIQLIIEIKDGFAPLYGFSVFDLAAGAAGSFYPMAQHYLEPVGRTHLKFSYYRRHDDYFTRDNSSQSWINDYINQTYWLTMGVHDLLPPGVQRYWPEALGVALGLSADETLDGIGGGNVELYLGLDINLMAFVPEGQDVWWAHLLRALNYYRLPLPAVRLTPRITLLPFE